MPPPPPGYPLLFWIAFWEGREQPPLFFSIGNTCPRVVGCDGFFFLVLENVTVSFFLCVFRVSLTYSTLNVHLAEDANLYREVIRGGGSYEYARANVPYCVGEDML